MLKENNDENRDVSRRQHRPQKNITPQRLRNIGLFYLKRFESSVENLRSVLNKRVQAYVRENPEFDQTLARQWIEDILTDFQRLHYLDDERYAEIKIRGYLSAGKPARYIEQKLRAKGIDDKQISQLLDQQEYDPVQMALRLAHRKRIGPYRADDEQRKQYRQKDMGTLIRAGFDYDVVLEVLDFDAACTDLSL